MASNSVDSRLKHAGVHFLPWIGPEYELGFKGRRLLIVGESHYLKKSEDRPDFTRKYIKWAIAGETESPLCPRIQHTVLGVESSEVNEGAKTFWESVVFYNFLQISAGEVRRTRIPKDAFRESQSPFRAVLAEHRPERILLFSKEAWKWIGEADEFAHDDVQSFRLLDGTEAWCLALPHPTGSYGYSWRRWHPVVTSFLADPRTAVGLLN